MPLAIPAELKKITPYIRRAEELDKDKSNAESRLVAYYCRQHAVHTGIALAQSDEAKNCLGEILGALEVEKEAMDSFTRDEAKFLCASFADKIFAKADTEDRNGQASRGTGKTFYAAASFLEILQQFYRDDDESEEYLEIKEKSKYAKWKATDILKAIKEGCQPTPGGYGENLAEQEETTEGVADTPEVGSLEIPPVENSPNDGVEEDAEPVVRIPETPLMPPADESIDSNKKAQSGTEMPELAPPPPYPMENSLPDILPPPAPAPAPAPAAPLRPPMTFNPPAPPPPMSVPSATRPPATNLSPSNLSNMLSSNAMKGKKVTKAQFADAKELTQFALAALDDKNADLAAERLVQALQVLGR